MNTCCRHLDIYLGVGWLPTLHQYLKLLVAVVTHISCHPPSSFKPPPTKKSSMGMNIESAACLPKDVVWRPRRGSTVSAPQFLGNKNLIRPASFSISLPSHLPLFTLPPPSSARFVCMKTQSQLLPARLPTWTCEHSPREKRPQKATQRRE